MAPVFAHGRLRLYLLKLLDEAPRHGYEVIRLLEERFQGLYAPSAGTVYPRLAKLEAEGLVTHTTEGGRKVYAITDAGRAELADRSGELADLELEIRDSVAELAAEIRDGVRGAAGELRREMREAAKEARASGGRPEGKSGAGAGVGSGSGSGAASGKPFPDPSDFFDGSWGDNDGWRQAKEEFKRAKQEWKEQARRAKDETRRAREDAQRARRQAQDAQETARAQAQEEVQRIARRVQAQVQDHFTRGDWPTGVREGLTELAKEFGEFGKDLGKDFGRKSPKPTAAEEPKFTSAPEDVVPTEYVPEWAQEDTTGNPSRDLDRLLDRFRDDIRDAARDHGVTEDQLRDARRHLSSAAAHIAASLRTPKG
ncbi:helix-turn-helix transcriptional regulator [Streptomyces sp. BA2]|uniref:helix-turn-helix transcriptional regulator n=1 Tax=Streptomyces sp. BA2 TaxID=436595 RepID=UPI0013266D34|nr:helix-turn-helix transcriptional regulator [Streptomyces sp. BA2]MWA13586.1 PadR family transcriptional regulator [Streptomyces sp. BA2]